MLRLSTARLCGSERLNQEFLGILQSMITPEDMATILGSRRKMINEENKAVIYSEALREFEGKKKNFWNDEDKRLNKPMFIKIPGSERILRSPVTEFRKGGLYVSRYNMFHAVPPVMLIVKRTLIRESFDRVVEDILDMVEQQGIAFNSSVENRAEERLKASLETHTLLGVIIADMHKRIVLVGGFSASHYLYDAMVNACSGPSSKMGYTISVIRPEEEPYVLSSPLTYDL